MKAAAQEQRAKVIEAEAEVPRAMAAALREGKLGVMDYYEMKNTIADTAMRDFHCFHGRGRERAAQEVNREGRGAKHGRNAAVSAGRRALCDR